MKQSITKTFTAASSSAALLCQPGDVLAWVEDGTFDTVSWAIERSANGGLSWEAVQSFSATDSGSLTVPFGMDAHVRYRATVYAIALGEGSGASVALTRYANDETVYVHSAAVTLVDGYHGKMLVSVVDTDPVTITVPVNGSLREGFACSVSQLGTGTVTLSGGTLHVRSGYLPQVSARYGVMNFRKIDDSAAIVSGDLAADA